MKRRVIGGVALAVALALGLAGCQAAGSFDRTLAQADVAKWTSEAAHAASNPAPTAQTKLNAFQACRSDQGLVQTTSEWRTVTYLAIPASRQDEATRAIEKFFTAAGWRAAKGRGYANLVGPGNQKLQGLITIQTAGSTQLSVAVFSPCYA